MIAIAPASTRRSAPAPAGVARTVCHPPPRDCSVRRWSPTGRWMHCALGVLAVMAGRALAAGAQQPARAPPRTAIGQGVNAETSAPLPAAPVLLMGTLLRDSTNGEGRVIIRQSPAGNTP